jgi:L-lysine 6-transaminase
MEIIEEDQLCDNAETVGSFLLENLQKLSKKYDKISNVRGRGLITAFDFPNKEMRDQFVSKGMENNVMFLGCGNQSIRFRPALNIQKEHIEEGLAVIEKIVPSL